MIINTVGKIILENGQKVYKRFGAAVVLKIKLGTGAFANVVNNAATTEEGFVPDARVVAQQQETISALQQQVESLNSAIESQKNIKNIAQSELIESLGAVENLKINSAVILNDEIIVHGDATVVKSGLGNKLLILNQQYASTSESINIIYDTATFLPCGITNTINNTVYVYNNITTKQNIRFFLRYKLKICYAE